MKIQLVLIGCATIGIGHAAQAQTTGLVPVRVKVGAVLPSSSGRDFGGTRLGGEVEVLLPRFLPGSGKTGITLGYSQGSKNGARLRVIPLAIERLYGFPNPLQRVTGNLYGGIGVGPYFLRASTNGASASKTTLGGYGVVGYQFPGKMFVEAKYHVAGRVAGISPNGLALMVGRSF